VADVDVALAGIVEVTRVRAIGIDEEMDSKAGWTGSLLSGLSPAEQVRRLGQRLELRLPSGRTATVLIADNQGGLRTPGWPPFPIVFKGDEVDE